MRPEGGQLTFACAQWNLHMHKSIERTSGLRGEVPAHHGGPDVDVVFIAYWFHFIES